MKEPELFKKRIYKKAGLDTYSAFPFSEVFCAASSESTSLS